MADNLPNFAPTVHITPLTGLLVTLDEVTFNDFKNKMIPSTGGEPSAADVALCVQKLNEMLVSEKISKAAKAQHQDQLILLIQMRQFIEQKE